MNDKRTKTLCFSGAAVYPTFMPSATRWLGWSVVFAAALVGASTGCATARRSTSVETAAAPVETADPAIQNATGAFDLGRDAALNGNIECARLYFDAAIAAVQPEGEPPATGDRLAFSFELWEGIQRYEALAGATEEAGTSHGQVSPELEAIENPEATPEEISAARAEVAAALDTTSSDVPLVVN